MTNPSENSSKSKLLKRKTFIRQGLTVIGATALGGHSTPLLVNPLSTTARSYTVQDIINIILKEIPGAPFPHTVDTLKSGSPDQRVSGIVTTMFATAKVIQEAARLNTNFIIAHEPSYYNHEDELNWVANNQVVNQKLSLLKKENIAIWRFHDYWHSHRPDGIRQGVLKAAGWLEYYQEGKPLIQIPPVSLKELIVHFQQQLGISHVRSIGDPSQICQSIALMPGAAGGQRQISVVEKEKTDVLIVGELHEWETSEYIRDARYFGSKTALIILGHSVSE
jgi:putative NIF3 family GTP cyclohydrolase 1 type 2